MNNRRIHILHDVPLHTGPVLYWMHRDFRARDNWGLIHARLEALGLGQPIGVVICLAPTFLDATATHFNFLLRGLEETILRLRQARIAVFILQGEPEIQVSQVCQETNAALLVTDFDPLNIKKQWISGVQARCTCRIHEVDSRNIVPARIVSHHREFMARTLRPKIQRLLPEFLDPFPDLPPHPHAWPWPVPNHSLELRPLSRGHLEAWTSTIMPGENAARKVLHAFLDHGLARYELRNDPNQEACSNLSAHLHFGMLSAQRVVLESMRQTKHPQALDAFLEQLIIRRELADNFCLHTPDYDRVTGFWPWAQETLHKHARDPRDFLYTLEEFQQAKTHDSLWNAAQCQMLCTGKMHGYLRMYWAKKILEWSASAEEALRTAIFLNDRHSLDGRDSNGYTGIAWSLGGVHDRGWTERPVFGTIRFMNLAGAHRKFNVNQYVRTWLTTPTC